MLQNFTSISININNKRVNTMNSAQFLKTLGDLPTLPAIANQINICEKENSTAKSLAGIISKDPSLTAKVLKLANSAYYGLAKQVTTLDRAVTVLGFNTLKSLAMAVSIYKIFKEGTEGSINIKGLWQHSLACAVATKAIVQVANNDKDIQEQGFLCGILHDIGIIAFAHKLPKEIAEVLKTSHEMHSPQSDVEKNIIGFTHHKIGSMMAENWNFPTQYVNAIRWHHGPLPPPDEEHPVDAILTRAVLVGNQMAKALHLGESTDPSSEKIPVDVWHYLGIRKENLQELRSAIEQGYVTISESWDIDEE